MDTRPIWMLDASLKGCVLGLCLSAGDLRALAPDESGATWSPTADDLCRRSRLRAACRRDTPLARRVADLLDVRHAALVLELRASPVDAVRARVRAALEAARLCEYAGLLWATATDARPAVQHLAATLAHATFAAGCAHVRGERA
jgi:hypothetical protein